jgi:hypothetical protein
MIDPNFQSEAMSSQGAELRVMDDEPGTPLTVTSLTNTNPATLVVSDMTKLKTGQPVKFTGTGEPTVDGKTFVLGAENTGPASFDVTGLDGTGFAAAVATGSVGTGAMYNLCEAKTFNGFDGQASEMDVTTMCSAAKEVRMGLQDFGSFNFTMNYVPSDPGTAELQEAKGEGTPRWFELMLPDDSGSWIFEAFVKQMTIAGGVDQPLTTNVVLRITGAPTFVEGTGATMGAQEATRTPPPYQPPQREHRAAA